eukprot:239598_1
MGWVLPNKIKDAQITRSICNIFMNDKNPLVVLFPYNSKGLVPSCDAIHFLPDIQQFNLVLETEWCFPLKGNTHLDVLEEVITLIDETVKFYHQKRNEYNFEPHFAPFTMRIIKASNCLLSMCYDGTKQYQFYVCVDVACVQINTTKTKIYYQYIGELLTFWSTLFPDKSIKPHWGKLWQNFENITGIMRRRYEKEIKIFNEYRKKSDPKGMFMNGALSKIFT